MKQVLSGLLILICSTGIAQQKGLYIQGGPVVTKYNGELGDYNNSGGSVHIGLQFNKKQRLNGALNLGFGSVTGEDINFAPQEQISGVPRPNTFFQSNFIFFNYELHYNILKKPNYQVYISQGVGVFRFNPKDDLDNDLQDLTETRVEGETYRNASLMLPTSIGGAYFLANDYGIGLQLGFYNTLTKYLDNIAELGDNGNDNILFFKLAVYAPLK